MVNQLRCHTNITTDSVVDGEGLRMVIWTQGCVHQCEGCHNPSTHDLYGGNLLDINSIKQQINQMNYHDGITFSGGEPMLQAHVCTELARYAHSLGMTVWCYTGYRYEEIKDQDMLLFLKEIDVLVDGKFIQSLKTMTIPFIGSSNQRMIDVKKTMNSTIIDWCKK